MSNGIVNGVCVDPEAYFFSLVKGTSPADYPAVILSIREDLWRYGIGYQARSDGTPSSRLFLPTAACPDARPLTEQAKFLGVRQVAACWLLTADTVKNDAAGHPAEWAWVLGGEGTYQPVAASVPPVVPPVTPPAPVKPPYLGDAYYNQVSAVLDADYREAGQSLNAGSGCWFGRVDYEIYVEGLTPDAAIAKHRPEWRSALGLH